MPASSPIFEETSPSRAQGTGGKSAVERAAAKARRVPEDESIKLFRGKFTESDLARALKSAPSLLDAARILYGTRKPFNRSDYDRICNSPDLISLYEACRDRGLKKNTGRRKRDHSGKIFTDADIIAALDASDSITSAARRISISGITIKKWRTKNQALARAFDACLERGIKKRAFGSAERAISAEKRSKQELLREINLRANELSPPDNYRIAVQEATQRYR